MSLEIVTLHDPKSGDRAQIAVGFGFNCFSYQVERDGKPVEVLWSHEKFASGTERPSGSGIPLLFPFAGRIAGTSFEYEGQTYQLEEGDGQGNAIHGFVMQRPWRLIEQTRARAVAEFQASVDDPALLDRWPADFAIRAAYALREGLLACDIRVTNPARRPLPFALATHAYFRVPPGGGGHADSCIVQVPVRQNWELAGLVPTGRVHALAESERLDRGLVFEHCRFDNVFSGLAFEAGRTATTIHNATAGHTLRQTFDDSFGYCVVYNPPHREAICMEPYTALPNAFALRAQGVETGLRFLAPGESYETTLEIELV
jgi:aldose 1-epimerase